MSAWEGSQWQEAMERQREQIKRSGRSNCGHPGCEIVDDAPVVTKPCSIENGIMISVPPGKHVHFPCDRHPDGHVIFGSPIR